MLCEMPPNHQLELILLPIRRTVNFRAADRGLNAEKTGQRETVSRVLIESIRCRVPRITKAIMISSFRGCG